MCKPWRYGLPWNPAGALIYGKFFPCTRKIPAHGPLACGFTTERAPVAALGRHDISRANGRPGPGNRPIKRLLPDLEEMFMRRSLLALGFGLAALMGATSPVFAQDWPTKPVRVVVPLTAGSASDVMGANRDRSALPTARPAGDHRKPPGRRQHHRHERSRQGRARWPHAADQLVDSHGDAGDPLESRLRYERPRRRSRRSATCRW